MQHEDVRPVPGMGDHGPAEQDAAGDRRPPPSGHHGRLQRLLLPPALRDLAVPAAPGPPGPARLRGSRVRVPSAAAAAAAAGLPGPRRAPHRPHPARLPVQPSTVGPGRPAAAAGAKEPGRRRQVCQQRPVP